MEGFVGDFKLDLFSEQGVQLSFFSSKEHKTVHVKSVLQYFGSAIGQHS